MYVDTDTKLKLYPFAEQVLTKKRTNIWFTDIHANLSIITVIPEKYNMRGISVFFQKAILSAFFFDVLHHKFVFKDEKFELGRFFNRYSSLGNLYLNKSDAIKYIMMQLQNCDYCNPLAKKYISHHPEFLI